MDSLHFPQQTQTPLTQATVSPLTPAMGLHSALQDPVSTVGATLNRASAIAFIDPTVDNYQTLIQGLQPGTEIHVLDNPHLDAISQITQTLAGRSGISSLHVFSHGAAGSLNFNDMKLDLGDLGNYASQFQSWATALTADADIQLYGCNVVESDQGKELVLQLSQLTGADVAASNDLTGHAALGGDWQLEFSTGRIETPDILQPWAQAAYQNVLATFTVTNTNDSGVGSLRQAIFAANATAGADTINFQIGAPGSVQTINLLSDLPGITDQVILDGWSQGGADYTGAPLIQLNRAAIPNSNGLSLYASNSVIRGFAVNSSSSQSTMGFGISLVGGAANNWIYGNNVGTDSTGTVALGYGQAGIWVDQSAGTGNRIGTNSDGVNDAAERNVVSGNGYVGILLAGNGNIVTGNLVGTNATGTAALANGTYGGILIYAAANNVIGGSNSSDRNLISGNDRGVMLFGAGAFNNRVQGNWIGTDITGTLDLGNLGAGVQIEGGATRNLIGSNGDRINDLAEGNVIANNHRQNNTIGDTNANVRITGAGTNQNVVAGNLIGVNATGTGSFPTSGGVRGVLIDNGAASNVIGGVTAATRNIISGHQHVGIDIVGANANNNRVIGNFVGTDVTGTVAIGNGTAGVQIYDGAQGNFIGTNSDGWDDVAERNLISGNTRGVVLIGSNARHNTVAGNFIGTDVTGNARLGNTIGIVISNASDNLVGGTASAASNVISGNNTHGIVIEYSNAVGNAISGNYIGTNATGTAAVANTQNGILINSGASYNVIGNPIGNNYNLISGNGQHGIQIDGPTSVGNQILLNLIGTDGITATTAIANGGDGIHINNAPDNTIGTFRGNRSNVISGNQGNGITITGVEAISNQVQGNYIGLNFAGRGAIGNNHGVVIQNGATDTVVNRNTISGNRQQGVLIQDASTMGNRIQGNLIGTDASGTVDVGNAVSGVRIVDAPNNLIGGNTPGHRNVISGNNAQGIVISGSNADGNVIQGNFIGTNQAGNAALGNGFHGVQVMDGVQGTLIGTNGDGAGDQAERNLISGNGMWGIILEGAGNANNTVAGNLIGTDLNGTAALGNALDGILVYRGAQNNMIGGTRSGTGNTIAFNNGAGILLVDGTGNAVLGNSMFGNSRLGIDLENNGPTGNDVGDLDTGVNNRQNFPVLATANIVGSSTVVTGSLNSVANATFRVEFFANGNLDASGFGEGSIFLGFALVTTDSNGNGDFNFTVDRPLPAGQFITATATDFNNNTSEFSAGRVVNQLPVATNDSVMTNEDTTIGINVLSNDTDADGHSLTLGIASNPANGTVVINNNGTVDNLADDFITYTPNANFNGNDSFIYQVSDGQGGFATATVNISVNSINDQPIANNDVATVMEGQSVVIPVLANDTDADGDPLAVTTFINPSQGVLAWNNDGTLSYTANYNFAGTDSFTYTVSDGQGGSSVATVNLNVTPLNLIGTPDADTLTGTDTNNRIDGRAGNDGITGGRGDDTMTGGGGQDRYVIRAGDGTDIITDFGGIGRGVNPAPEVLAEVDTLKFEGAGLTARNMILTQLGNDLEITFRGVANTRVILQNFSLENLDNLSRSTGGRVDLGNILFAGETTFQDSFDVFDADSIASIITNANSVTFLNDRDNRVEGFNNANDVINGQGGSDRIDGRSGDDWLRGGVGNDELLGGNGSDQLEGEEGDDILLGGADDDVLIGGIGNDRLIGGAGRDRFVYQSINDGSDTIVDFNPNRDLLDLTALFTSLGYAGSDPLADGLVQLVQNGADTEVQIRANTAASFSVLVILRNTTATTLALGSNLLF